VELTTIGGDGPSARADAASIAELAGALTELEARFAAERPEGVLLVDDSDTALAAALVAAKLLIPIKASRDATSPASDNARLIAQLADTYTAPS
jgi:UDP-N-acetylglucosamine 2-epimerase